jgi:hypothetical protein
MMVRLLLRQTSSPHLLHELLLPALLHALPAVAPAVC